MTELETAIREKLLYDHVTFAELSRIEGFRGDLSVVSPVKDNVVFWSGISHEAMNILERLRDEGAFHFAAASGPLVYFLDGRWLQLPLVRRAKAYKTPHWLPVVLRPGPAPRDKTKLKPKESVR